ncbi:hypothetical protein ACLB2K_056711 [Fragaria x ananassa]
MVGDAVVVFWGGGALSSAPEGGERRDVRTLRPVRTSTTDPAYIYIYKRYRAHVRTVFKVRTELRSPPDGADDGAPPPQQTPAASPTIFPPRRVHRIPVSGEIDFI